MREHYGLPHLDGLRGVAALIVVFAHITAGFVPAMYFGAENRLVPGWQTAFASGPLFVMIDGSFAVYVFFVLSGFVIAASTDHARYSLMSNCAARFIRLSIPCAASIILAAPLLVQSQPALSQSALIVDHWWLRLYDRDVATLGHLIRECLGGFYWSGSSSFNAVLWTMQRELIGSLAIYAVFALYQRAAQRFAVGIGLAILVALLRLEPQSYVCFVAGSLLYLGRSFVMRAPQSAAMGVLVIGVLLGGRPFFPPASGSAYFLAHEIAGRAWLLVWPLAATCIVTSLISLRPAITLLGSRACRFLGRISFALYLVHLPLLLSLMSYLYMGWGQHSPIAFVLSGAAYVTISIIVAFVFTVAIDEPAIKLSRRVRLGYIESPVLAPR